MRAGILAIFSRTWVRSWGEVARTTLKQMCISVVGVKLWNSQQNDLQNCIGIYQLKNLYKLRKMGLYEAAECEYVYVLWFCIGIFLWCLFFICRSHYYYYAPLSTFYYSGTQILHFSLYMWCFGVVVFLFCFFPLTVKWEPNIYIFKVFVFLLFS